MIVVVWFGGGGKFVECLGIGVEDEVFYLFTLKSPSYKRPTFRLLTSI